MATSSAQAITINPAISRLDMAAGCGDTFCAFDIIYGLDEPNPSLTGTFDLTAGTLTFSVDLVFASLSGSDGAVTAVEFSTVTYSGSVTAVDEGGGLFSITDQLASISGTLTPISAGAPVAFNLVGVRTTGICNESPGSLTCGLTIGSGGASGFAIDVNGNERYFRHSIDFSGIVPEPSSALLLGIGLCALGGRRRKQDRRGSSDEPNPQT